MCRQLRDRDRLGQRTVVDAQRRRQRALRGEQPGIERTLVHHALLPGAQVLARPVLPVHLDKELLVVQRRDQRENRQPLESAGLMAAVAEDDLVAGRDLARTGRRRRGQRPHLDRLDIAAGVPDLGTQGIEVLAVETGLMAVGPAAADDHPRVELLRHLDAVVRPGHRASRDGGGITLRGRHRGAGERGKALDGHLHPTLVLGAGISTEQAGGLDVNGAGGRAHGRKFSVQPLRRERWVSGMTGICSASLTS